jgi:hypothetical protein
MSDPMLSADPGTPFVPRTLSDFGEATNDTRVFSATPVAGSDFPDPVADGDSDDEVTIRQSSLKAPANPPSSVGLPTLFDSSKSNKRIDTLLEQTALHNQLNSAVEHPFSKFFLSSTRKIIKIIIILNTKQRENT